MFKIADKKEKCMSLPWYIPLIKIFFMSISNYYTVIRIANIEIKDEVGEDNIIIFGLNAEEVLSYHKHGGYSAWEVCNNDPKLKRVTDDLINGKYCSDKDRFRSIYENLLTYNDEFFVLKDFESYLKAQNRVNELYKNQNKWQKICGINIAHSGIFSSDRTIKEYATGIWGSTVIYKNL